ncbi:hypothetical protein HZB01_01420 [Candidatus Woesearchaeota archaeon]|nr:hypothetical protein [Candidatus Woesearchaeota archaeon]
MKKSQASMEYIIIAAFAIMVVFGVLSFFYSRSQESIADLQSQQINKIGPEIVDAADDVYRSGEPSRRTITLTFPEGITSLYTTDNKEMVFCFTNGGDVVFISKSPLVLNLASTDVRKGQHKFLLQAQNNCTCLTTPEGGCPSCGTYTQTSCP